MKRLILTVLAVILAAATASSAAMVRNVRALPLGESSITINVYENAGAAVTFFAPHNNEQTGLSLAKEFVEKRGGRLVEIVSLDANGKPQRYLKFNFGGKQYTVDPNRIYTENGRACGVPAEVRATVAAFATEVLKMIYAADLKSPRTGERFIVAVHNNSDVTTGAGNARTDLTAVSFFRGQSDESIEHGAYEAQADGVFLSNTEIDEDNFVFLSTPLQMSYFAEKGFNVVVQKPQSKLTTTNCKIDDGSLSIYSGQNGVPYVCLEADNVSGSFRQRLMLEAVYGLLQ